MNTGGASSVFVPQAMFALNPEFLRSVWLYLIIVTRLYLPVLPVSLATSVFAYVNKKNSFSSLTVVLK